MLAIAVGIAFGRALQNDFVNYDDSEYVYENSHITAGISFGGILWAFTHVHAANWHPLTTISHMLDCQIYGLHPWGHHLTNILLHGAAVVLLFLALTRLTSSIGPSAFVAALFAVHPLRVESVAWVSERKDVLSGVFFMLTLLAYARYVQRLHQDSHSLRRYLMVVLWLALGLLSKPTLVTLPFVLLLLDYWPLERWRRIPGEKHRPEDGSSPPPSLVRLIVEKIPLFALSGGSCVATVIAQQKVIAANLQMTFGQRLINAVTAYAAYLGDMIYPAHLVVSHPYAEGIDPAPLVCATALIVLVTVVTFVWRRRYPFLLVGWLWYLGVLVPMIGFVQVSAQARADRYTYLAQIGIYLIIAWGGAALIRRFQVKGIFAAVPAVVIILLLSWCSYAQAWYWHDTETLWRHALDASTYDYIAHDSLGYALLQKGQVDEAIAEYQKALQIKPDYVDSHNNLANALLQKGDVDQALQHYRRALQIEPDFAEPHNNLGNVLFKQGRVDEAIEQYKFAVARRPQFAEVQYNLGSAYLVKGDWDKAQACLKAALKIDSGYAQAHNKLGITFGATGKTDEALREFKEAVRLNPNYAEAHFNLGYILAHTGHRNEAIEHLVKAVRLKPDSPDARRELRQLGFPAMP